MESTGSIFVSSKFDGGNIRLVNIANDKIHVEIRDDPLTAAENAIFKQYFYFRVSGCKERSCEYTIINAGECSYATAWNGYNVCASYDREYWFRVPTTYDVERGHLIWNHSSSKDLIFFSFFAPYSQERHLSLLSKCASSPRASVKCLGYTLDERTMDMVTIGTGPMKIWAIARQHPGECMAEWWADGYISRLLDTSDALVNDLLTRATFYVIPNMNPDGSFRGHLRTNAGGANLNREWRTKGDYVAPSLERSPEVYHGKSIPI
jgi:murein tripeptide amidase MpaA